MKAITALVIIAVVMMVALSFKNSDPITYVKQGVTTEVVKEVTPDWASDEEAVQAAKDVIRKKELQAELAQLDANIKELQERRKVVTGELTTY